MKRKGRKVREQEKEMGRVGYDATALTGCTVTAHPRNVGPLASRFRLNGFRVQPTRHHRHTALATNRDITASGSIRLPHCIHLGRACSPRLHMHACQLKPLPTAPPAVIPTMHSKPPPHATDAARVARPSPFPPTAEISPALRPDPPVRQSHSHGRIGSSPYLRDAAWPPLLTAANTNPMPHSSLS